VTRMTQTSLRRVTAAATAALVAIGLMAGCADARLDAEPTAEPEFVKLQPFDPDVPTGAKPDSPARFGIPGNFDAGIAREISDALQSAVESCGIDYTSAQGNGDIAQFRTQAETMFSQGLGGWFRYPVYVAEDLEQSALESGVYSVSAGSPNSHTQVASNSNILGIAQVDAAAEWAAENIEGTARVVILNNGTVDPASRDWYEKGILVALEDHPELELVADLEVGYTAEESADTMATVLQAHPDVNIVIGASGSIAGVLATYEALGRGTDPTVYLSAKDSGDDLLAKVEAGDGSVFRSAFATPWAVIGYAMGAYTCDWMDGRSVPKLLTVSDAGPININSPEAAEEWRAEMKNPKGVFDDPERFGEHLVAFGNISYDTRDEYWTFQPEDVEAVIER
jgi:ribose transport system substrate-binding protein